MSTNRAKLVVLAAMPARLRPAALSRTASPARATLVGEHAAEQRPR